MGSSSSSAQDEPHGDGCLLDCGFAWCLQQLIRCHFYVKVESAHLIKANRDSHHSAESIRQSFNVDDPTSMSTLHRFRFRNMKDYFTTQLNPRQ